MADKEKKNKIADILMDFQEEYSNEVINRPMLASLYAGNILSFIDSLQEEPTSEDLEEAAEEWDESLYRSDAFKAGAKWQKKQTINKACEWIKEHSYDYLEFGQAGFGADFHYPKMIEDFRRAMEG